MKISGPFSKSSICLPILLTVAVVGNSPAAADDEPNPGPTPASNRSPTFVRSTPAGAIQLQIEPPSVGTTILEDALTGPGALPAIVRCATGNNVRDFVDEGVILKITGACAPGTTFAVIDAGRIEGLDIPDAEVRAEFKFVTGAPRAQVAMLIRALLADDCYHGYAPIITGQGAAAILKVDGCGSPPTLGSRGDLAGRVRLDDWNTMAVRLEGPNIWLYLNDEVILSLADSSFDHGGLNFRLLRIGDVNDPAESAAVLRNLRVSELLPRGSASEGATPAP
jgi:hypothetical protein